MKTYHRIMEYFWLFVGVVSLAFGAYTIYRYGMKDNSILLAVPAMAFILFFMRRFYRKQQENQNDPS